MATNPTDMTPVEIDTVLSENYEAQARVEHSIVMEVQHLDYSEKNLVRFPDSEYHRNQVLKSREDIKALQAERAELITASVPYQAEYNRRPWNRYFLVKNENGHVHRGMNCTTCFATTRYGWLVELADCDEGAMVEEWGERACTVCFPDAPTNPAFNRPARIDREARDAKDAEKAAKAAAKAEKAITAVDGSPLRVDGWVIATKVAARNKLSSLFQDIVLYGSDHPSDFVGQVRPLVAALDAAGVDWKPVPGRAVKKMIKDLAKARKENRFGATEAQLANADDDTQANVKVAEALAQELGVSL